MVGLNKQLILAVTNVSDQIKPIVGQTEPRLARECVVKFP